MMQKVHPELKAALENFPGFDIKFESLPFIRQFPAKPPSQTPGYEEVFIDVAGRTAPLRCLLVDPIPNQNDRPVLVYYHGGGFVFGSPEITLPVAQRLAEDVGCLIVLIDYRLAPEHPFPAALEDGKQVLTWLTKNANGLRIDKSRIALGGDSAGGGHAVVLTAAMAKRHDLKPSFLFLAYPMLDNQTGLTGETGTSVWTAENNKFGWQSYLGEGDIVQKIANGAVPSKLDTLEDFPPTFLVTGTLDLFFAENMNFVQKLEAQGVAVTHHTFEGAYHAFDVLVPDANISKQFHALCVRRLKQAFDIS